MKVPLEWLGEYVDISGLDPHQTGEILTMRGLEVDAVNDTESGPVLDIELTPNRGDCASIIGVARELAAACGKPFSIPKVDYDDLNQNQDISDKIKIQCSDKCPAYHLKKISSVTIGPSPEWLRKRLEASSVRPLNNVIDITNYVMLETGQPLHAFDEEKISGGTVTVREAVPGENLLMLDGVEREFTGGEVVIADNSGPVAVGGVMGGEKSAVSGGTKDILLESAYFLPESISRTEKELKVKTEASYRFSREIDKGGIVYALERAASLMEELCGAKPVKGKLSFSKLDFSERKVKVNIKQVNSLLGISLTGDIIKKYLESLNFTVKLTEDTFETLVPSYRNDVTRPVDIIEEIARVHGYDRIPAKLPGFRPPAEYFKFQDLFIEGENSLRAGGYREAVTHTLTDSDKLEKIYPDRFKENFIEIKNPVSADLNILRPSLFTGLLAIAGYNANRKSPHLRFYERGPVFLREEKEFSELSHIAYIAAGKNYFEAKQAMETLLDTLKQDYKFSYRESSDYFKENYSGKLSIDGRPSGEFGVFKKNILDIFDMDRSYTGGYLVLERAVKDKIKNINFKKWSPYPAIFRDLSLICPAELTHDSIYATIKSSGKGILKNAEIADNYTGKKLGLDKKSITYALQFSAEDRTLTSEEVDYLIKDILGGLKEKFGVTLRPD